MKRIKLTAAILALFCLLESEQTWAVGGISASKLVVPDASTVPTGRFEFEPNFEFISVDDSGDSVEFNGNVRFTLGVLSNLEIGANAGLLRIEDSDDIERDAGFGDAEAGLKFRFLDEGKNSPFSVAYQGGITVPTSGDDAPWVFEPAGLILTKNFNDKLSMDADVVIFLVEDESAGFVADIGFGYFVTDWFQPCIEAGYSFENPEDGENISVLNISFGFTSPVNETLIIVLFATKDVYTDNADKATQLSAAFTFLF